MSRFAWSTVTLDRASVVGTRLANAIYHTLGSGLNGYAFDEAVQAAITELLSGSSGAFNVKSFGAKGDGVTDDTVAIQEAIDTASAAGGGVLLFPIGVYKLGSQLNVESNVFMLGAGPGASIIDGSTLDLGSQLGMLNVSQKTDVVMRGLHFRYLGTGDTNCISFHGCSRVWVDSCRFTEDGGNTNNKTAVAFYDGASGAGSASGMWVTRNHFTPSDNAVLVQGRASGPFYLDDVIVADNVIDGSEQATGVFGAIKVDLYIRRCTVRGNHIQGAGLIQDAINVQENAYNCIVADNIIEDIARDAIRFEDGQSGGVVDSLIITGNSIRNARHGTNWVVSAGGSGEGIIIAQNVIHDCSDEPCHEASGGLTGVVYSGNILKDYLGDGGILSRSTGSVIINNWINSTNSVRSIRIADGSARVSFNQLLTDDGTSTVQNNVGSSAVFVGNAGYVTEANGQATLANGTTSIAVTHGLGLTPDVEDISVTPIEAWGAMTQFWVPAGSITATQFTINADQDPTQDVDFAWTASVQ